MKTKKPIVLSKNAVALIQIFTLSDDPSEIFWSDLQPFMTKETYEDAAKEFVKQFKDQCSINFMISLKKELEKEIQNEAQKIWSERPSKDN